MENKRVSEVISEAHAKNKQAIADITVASYDEGYDAGVEYATKQVNDDKFALGFSKGYDVGYETAENHAEEDKAIVEKRPKIRNIEEEIAAVKKMSQSLRGFEEDRNAETVDHAQMQRDLTVQNAKDDINGLRTFNIGKWYYITSDGDGFGTLPEFIVNADKRTVVVLMKGIASKEVHERGIAKAHPDDCFNVHIGKAIALRRALGKDVPDEYYNAPNPTEARVGDIVSLNYDGDELLLSRRVKEKDKSGRRLTQTGDIVVVSNGRYYELGRRDSKLDRNDLGRGFWLVGDSLGWLGEKQFKVVDDTRKDVL